MRDVVAPAAFGLLAVAGAGFAVAPEGVVPLLGLAALGIALAGAMAWPGATMAGWLILVGTTPEMWLSDMIGHHETIIALLKLAGLMIIGLAGLRHGFRFDRFNPSLPFVFMLIGGLVHGLWPALSGLSSLRSLIGASSPFAAGFLRPDARMRAIIIRCTIIGPGITVLFGLALFSMGLRALYGMQLGAIRLQASSSPAFLGGFAMIAIYAGLVEFVGRGRLREWVFIAVNFLILVASGARAPLALATFATIAALLLVRTPYLDGRRRIVLIACGGIGLGLVLVAGPMLHFVRVLDLIHLGDAESLSNRNLIWPYFEAAFEHSPWIGWGVGAGKVIVPLHSPIGRFLGTNAAHDEYLRIACDGGVIGAGLLFTFLTLWLFRGSAALPEGQRRLIRLVFFAFAVQSFTDNTLIATTSLTFFTWARAVFINPDEGSSPA